MVLSLQKKIIFDNLFSHIDIGILNIEDKIIHPDYSLTTTTFHPYATYEQKQLTFTATSSIIKILS